MDWTQHVAAGGEQKRQLILMRRKRRDFDYLTSGMLKELQEHLLASIHYKALYNWVLFVPSIAITLISGVLGILVKSGLDFSERTQVWIATWIAIIAAISVFWQSLMKQLNFGGRAELHDSAAMALRKLYDSSIMVDKESELANIKKTMHMIHGGSAASVTSAPGGDSQNDEEKTEEGNDSNDNSGQKNEDQDSSGSPDESPDEENDGSDQKVEHAVENKAHFTLSRQFDQAIQGCTSIVPVRISAAFDALESRVAVCNKSLFRKNSPLGTKKAIAWEKVYPALYHQMTMTIIHARGWPFLVPQAEWVVDKTLADFKKILSYDESTESDLLSLLVNRAEEIGKQYNGGPTEETGLVSGTGIGDIAQAV